MTYVQFNPDLLNQDERASDTMHALKKSLEDRTRIDSTGELGTLQESEEDHHELTKAAKTIQNKFREFQQRKSSSNLLQSIPQPADGGDSGSNCC